MKNLIKNINFWVILSTDLFLLFLAYFLSYAIRFEGEIPSENFAKFKSSVGFILLIKIVVFMGFKLYKGMWRYTGIGDLLNIVKATAVSSTGIVVGIFSLHRFQGFARSVFIIDAILTILLIGGIRLFIRLFLQKREAKNNHPLNSWEEKNEEGKRMMIIGAGDAGEKMLRELNDNPRLQYQVVGFLDDNPRKLGLQIHGIPVLGNIDQIAQVTKKHKIDEILIAISSATGKEMRRMVELCETAGLKFKTVPGIGELIDGRVSVKAIRDVSYEDLMGRKAVRLDMKKIGESIEGKRILMTGAGGSIGSELCRQIVRFNPAQIILLDCTENNLYQIEMELGRHFPELRFVPILGSVIHKDVVTKVFHDYQPSVVFHAAAYKHVPIMELNPWEAIFTNIKGTQTLLEVVRDFQVERFVFVSTDKAVRPTNIMGASKRVAELLIQGYSQYNQTRFMSVRFGNVIGSSGSVIPLFRKQIEGGGPVTVTHPEVTRYFMTIPEAAQLILQAGAMGGGGEIFILDMGTPIKILDLAKDLIRLSGFEPERGIEIKFIGLRPGEKLYEELITEGEGIIHTDHEKILVLRGNHCELELLKVKIKELLENAAKQDSVEIKKKLKEIVPEYQPSSPETFISPPNSSLHKSLQKPSGGSRRISAI